MRCVIISKARFVLNEGRPASVVINYDRFWSRYLAVYDEVVVVGMLFEREEPNARPVEGPGVTLVPIRGFRSPAGALRNMRTLSRALDEVYAPDAAFIIRSPNFLGDIMYRKLRRRGHPYGLELAGDPYLTFTPEGGFRPLQLLARWHFTRYARLECRDACAVAYTSAQQQRRYPAGRDTFTTIYSYLTLNDEDIVESPRVYDREAKPLSLVAVGSLQRLYKSPDVVIEALAECVGRGLDAHLTWVGGGRHLEAMRQLAQERGVADRVRLPGQVPAGEAVRERLDAADLYLIPSRAEGLPKALLEAMARGLPCIGSTVGSIPDLLDEDALVPPGDAHALAEKIVELAGNPERMTAMAARNLEIARGYRNEITDRRRTQFYSRVQQATERWLDG